MYCKKVIMARPKRRVTIKYGLPAKDFLSSNVSGHTAWIITRFYSQGSPMVPEQMCGTNYFISHLSNTRSSVSGRVVKTLVKLCIWEFDLNIRVHFMASLKRFRHSPSDKNQNKTKKKETNKLIKMLYLHVYNAPKNIERGEENVLLVFIIKVYLQSRIYVRVTKFNGRYLFHTILCSL